MSKQVYIGVDLGGTTVRVAKFASLEKPVPLEHHDFTAQRNYQTDMQSTAEAIRKVAGTDKILAVGFSMPGLLAESGATIVASGRHEHWHDKPIKADLEKAIGSPVIIRNDADAAALSEAMYGDGQHREFWFIIWGTGIGGGFVEYRGDQPFVSPSEPGHMTLHASDRAKPDDCGKSGCLESFIGGDGIEMRYGKPAKDISESQWEEVTNHAAQGIYNLLMVRPTKKIVFGGGIAIKQSERLPQIQSILKRQLKMVPAPRLTVATHGEDAGLIGALAAIRDRNT